MASYRGHLAFSSFLGAGYGALGVWQGELDWGPVLLGAGLTALGGLLPDLDSDNSVPVREVFGLAATATPFLLLQRVLRLGFSFEQSLVILAGVYLLIRYGLRTFFAKLTAHRGMFHSIPAMLIAGMAVFLLYHSPSGLIRLYLAGGVMVGFLSHLVLDRIYDVDLMGAPFRSSRSVGSPLKMFSASLPATLAAYVLLAGLGYPTYLEFTGSDIPWHDVQVWSQKAWAGMSK